MPETTKTLDKNPKADDLFYFEKEGMKWVVAAGGRWAARSNLTQAILALSDAPTAGIMFCSDDYSVNEMGAVYASTIQSVELADEEMTKLMDHCTYAALEDAQSLLDFAEERGVSTESLRDQIADLLCELEDKL